ncbi:MAG: hypothetical protein WC785_00865 [Tatlockia sp.]|jgi:hypothetical protein
MTKRAILTILKAIDRKDTKLAQNMIDSDSIKNALLEKKNNTPGPLYTRFIIQLFFKGIAHIGKNDKITALWDIVKEDLAQFFQQALSNAVLTNEMSTSVENLFAPRDLPRWKKTDTLYKTPYPQPLARLVIDSVLAFKDNGIQALISLEQLEWLVLTSSTTSEMVSTIEKIFHSQNPGLINHLLNFKIKEISALDWYLLEPNFSNAPNWKESAYQRISTSLNYRTDLITTTLAKPLFYEGTLSPLAFFVMFHATIKAKKEKCAIILKDKHINEPTKIAFFKEISALLPPEVISSLIDNKQRQAKPGFFESNRESSVPECDEKEEDNSPGEVNETEGSEARQNKAVIDMLKCIYEQIKNNAMIEYFYDNLTEFHRLMNNPALLNALENIRQDQNIVDTGMQSLLKEVVEKVIPLFDVLPLFVQTYKTAEGELEPKEYCEICRERLLQIAQIVDRQIRDFQPTYTISSLPISEVNEALWDCIPKQKQALALRVINSTSVKAQILDKKKNTPPEEFKHFAIQLFFACLASPDKKKAPFDTVWNTLQEELSDFLREALPKTRLNKISFSTANGSQALEENMLYTTPYPQRLAVMVIESILACKYAKKNQSKLINAKNIEWFVCQPNTVEEKFLRIERVLKSQNKIIIPYLFLFSIEGKKAINWYLLQPGIAKTSNWKKETEEHIHATLRTQIPYAIAHLGTPLFDGASPLVFLVKIKDKIEDKIEQCVSILTKHTIRKDHKRLFLQQISQALPECMARLMEAHPDLDISPPSLKRKEQPGFFEQNNQSKNPKRDEMQEHVATGGVSEAEQNRITLSLMTFALKQLDDCVDEGFSASVEAFRELMSSPQLLNTLENTTPNQTIIDIEMNTQLAEKLRLIIPLFKEPQLFPKDFLAADGPVEPFMYCELCFHVLTQVAEQLDISSPGFRL